jgi:hypothetical protein
MKGPISAATAAIPIKTPSDCRIPFSVLIRTTARKAKRGTALKETVCHNRLLRGSFRLGSSTKLGVLGVT